MKNSSRLIIILLFSILVACASDKQFKGRIGMTCMDLTNPYFKLIANVMQETAGKHGYEVVCLNGNNDPAVQNNQISDFIAQQYEAIFLNPADSRAAGEGVKRAHAAGVPVFSFDTQIAGEEAKELIISHIGSDNYQGGQLAAKSMIAATTDRGKIAIISHPEVNSPILRVNGFRDYLQENNSKLKIVTELPGKGNRNDAYNTATDILQAHPDIVGIFAINDPTALGTYAAIVKAGLENAIVVVGFDASPAGKQAVFEKKLYDSPQQFPRKMATGTVEAFIKYLDGKAIPKLIFIPCEHYLFETSLSDTMRIKEQW